MLYVANLRVVLILNFALVSFLGPLFVRNIFSKIKACEEHEQRK